MGALALRKPLLGLLLLVTMSIIPYNHGPDERGLRAGGARHRVQRHRHTSQPVIRLTARFNDTINAFLADVARRRRDGTLSRMHFDANQSSWCSHRRSSSRSTLNDHITQRGVYDRSAILPVVVDKLGVKLYARALNLPVPETLFYTTLPPGGTLEDGCGSVPSLGLLPLTFAAKATHTSGCNFIVQDGRVSGRRVCDPGSSGGAVLDRVVEFLRPQEHAVGGSVARDSHLERSCRQWLGMKYAHQGTEWAYSQLQPSMIIEEIIETSTHKLARDVKCFAIRGRTRSIQYVSGRFKGSSGKRDTFFVREGQDGGRWVPTTVLFGPTMYEENPTRFPEDSVLDRAAAMCDTAAEGFDFMRVDLLHNPETNALLLGELTPYPGAGTRRWSGKPNLNRKLGAEWCGGADGGGVDGSDGGASNGMG